MTRFSSILHRILTGVVFLALVLAAANYYMELGLIGDQRTAKIVMFALVAFVAVYAAYLMPTRQNPKSG